MDDHDTYQYVFTAEDVDAPGRRAIQDRIAQLYDTDVHIRVEPSPEGRLELVVPDRIPSTMKTDVRETLADELPYTLDRHERYILEVHGTWPTTRYRICIGFE